MNAELIKKLREARAAAQANRDQHDAAMRAITDAASAEKRDRLSDDETASFDAAKAGRDEARSRIAEIDTRIEELIEQDERDAASAAVIKRYETGFGAGIGAATITSEPMPYTRSKVGASFFRDTYLASKGDVEARERLVRNNKAVSVERAERARAGKAEARAISTTNGGGGEFVPPLWLEDDWIAYLRPGRVTADKCHKQALPAGTDIINIPKVNTGTAVAQQTTQNTGIQQTDLTTTSVQSAVITLAGGQTVSMQLVEQSPLNIDEMVLSDLAKDYNRQFGAYVIAQIAAAGTAVAWTQATPSFIGAAGSGAYYNTQNKAVSQLQTAIFEAPNAVLMHPRRWAWILTQLDGQSRPLVVPEAGGLFNAVGGQASLEAQGYVGSIGGLPVFLDPNLPINLGAGTNQDEIFVAKMDEVWLWEGSFRAEAFAQTYAQNLSLFVRLYNYVSVQAGRYPGAVQVITGTGAVTPTF
jgi:HK97 family phage major capsid protein